MGLTQDTAGVSGATEPGDLFGDQLAFAAPGLGDTVTRLAVSVPSEDGGAADSGLVQVFPVTNLAAELSYTQDSPGVPGGVDAGDHSVGLWLSCAGSASGPLSSGCPTTWTTAPAWST